MQLTDLIDFSTEDFVSFFKIAFRFCLNLGFSSIIILYIFARNSKNKDFRFTLFSFNLVIFALCTILNNVELSMGSGFGLFAVFTMMRYRSEQLQIKDMTYLLIMVGLGFVNATISASIGILEIVFLNISLVFALMVMEQFMFKQQLIKQKIKYNQLDLLKANHRDDLRDDLEVKVGARILDIQVDSINYQEGTANLVVKYDQNQLLPKEPFILEKELLDEESFLVSKEISS